ncbi:insulinase family protein [Actinosynnema sp. NPDC002837]
MDAAGVGVHRLSGKWRYSGLHLTLRLFAADIARAVPALARLRPAAPGDSRHAAFREQSRRAATAREVADAAFCAAFLPGSAGAWSPAELAAGSAAVADRAVGDRLEKLLLSGELAIVLVGDVDPHAEFDLPAHPRRRFADAVVAPSPDLLRLPGGPGADIRLGLPIPGSHDPEHWGALVVNVDFGHPVRSRLTRALRDTGLSYHADSVVFRRGGRTTLMIVASGAAGSADRLVEAVVATVADVHREPPVQLGLAAERGAASILRAAASQAKAADALLDDLVERHAHPDPRLQADLLRGSGPAHAPAALRLFHPDRIFGVVLSG